MQWDCPATGGVFKRGNCKLSLVLESGNLQTVVITGTFFHAFKHLLPLSFQLKVFLGHFFVFGMAADDGDVVATRLAHEEGGNALPTSRFVVLETVLYWDVAECRRLY